MASCAEAAADLPLVEGLRVSVDCNIDGLITAGTAVMAGPNSQLPVALTALLTLFVAIFGVRLMLGLASLRMGELVVMAVKVAIVMALATNLPLYKQLVFDTLFLGPEQLAGQLMGGSGGSEKALTGAFGALQGAFDEMQASAAYYAQRAPGPVSPLIGGPAFAAFALNLSSITLILATVGLLLTAKIVLALLLVMGPIFVILLLFDATRGLFEGWLRAAVAFSLAPILAVVTLVMALNMVRPHLDRLAYLQRQGEADIAPAVAILTLTLIAAGVSLAGGAATIMVAAGFRLPWKQRPPKEADAPVAQASATVVTAQTQGFTDAQADLQPRAVQVATAAAAMQRRDARILIDAPAAPRRALPASAGSRDRDAAAQPLGWSHRRPARPYAGAGGARRDR